MPRAGVTSTSTRPQTKPSPWPWICGEVLGTFVLVFLGCGSGSSAVLHNAQTGIFPVAVLWGIGVAVAVHLTSSLSGAHLNPAVTVAATLFAGFRRDRVLPYIGAQMAGAFLAAAVLYVIFGGSLADFEKKSGIVRGQPGSEASAIVFGEFYPNPAGRPLTPDQLETMPAWRAFVAEGIGTGVLVMVILGITDHRNTGRPKDLAPLLIGLTVTALISILGPLTMACLNPARDLAPRIFSSLAGWGTVPFTTNSWGWLTVYVCGPILGAIAGGALWKNMLTGFYRSTHDELV